MPGSRLGLAAVLTAGALWAQLVLLPMAVAFSQGAQVPRLSIAFGAIALAIAAMGFVRARGNRSHGMALLLSGFPIATGAASMLGGSRAFARFDPGAWSIAALTAVAFIVSTLMWVRQLDATVPASTVAMDPVPVRPPPPSLRGPAFGLLAAMAGVLAVIAPAIVTARVGLTRAERIAGADMVRARDALTAAGGLGIAILLVLGAGQPLLRGRASRRRRTTRGLAYLVWGIALASLLFLIHARSLFVLRWFHAGR